MIKLQFLIACIVFSSGVFAANWISASNENNEEYLLDKSFTTQGSLRTITWMRNFVYEGQKMSQKIVDSIDCSKNQVAQVSVILYKGHNFSGPTVPYKSPSIGKIEKIDSNSIIGFAYDLVCPSNEPLEMVWRLPDVLDDPLWTKPPVLSIGPALPDGAPIECPAQVDLTQALALGEVIDLALCNNSQIKQAWAAIKIQAGAVGEARSAYLPTASATYSPRQQTQVNYPQSIYNANSITNGKMSYANLTWRLFDFGGRAANRASANHLLEAALASHDASIQKAMTSTIQGYFDVLTAGATVKAKAQAADFAKSSWEATLRRENKGVSAKSDTLQAQTALAKAQLALSRADGDYRESQATLIFSMGLPTNTKLNLQEPMEHPQKQGLKDLNTWLSEAEEEHPAIKAAKAQWESAKEKITAARAAGLPTLDFVGNFYQNGYPNQGIQPTSSNTTTVGVTFTIPIFEGFGTTYKIRGQQAQAEKARADLEDATHQVLTEIVKSHADAVSALTNLESSQKLLEASRATVASSVKRYDLGAADILELLTTQTTLAEAQQERIRCIAEYRSARLRLLANAGILGHELERETTSLAPRN